MFFQCLLGASLYASGIVGCDLAEYCGVQIWDQTSRTAQCYDWFEQYLPKRYDVDKDYSEGLFEGNYELSLEQATINKYDYIYHELDLQPGMTVLDAGCGTGKWVEYLANKNINVIGLTLSAEQANVARQKEINGEKLDIRVADYRIRNEEFIGKFDRITALGSSEHVCSSLGTLRGNFANENCNEIRIANWKLFHEYLKPKGKLYITMLTDNTNLQYTYLDWFQAYVLERHYGGYYSSIEDITDVIVPKTGFKLTGLQDKTIDYHWSSVRDPNHFGHWTIKWDEDTLNKATYFLKGLFTDAHLAHRWLYYFFDTWMWQFGGYQEYPLSEEQVEKAPAQLKYFMLEKLE